MKYFCTLFDQGYLIKGLAMLRSLKRNCTDVHVYVLCMDEKTQIILMNLAIPYITCIDLYQLEDQVLLEAKKDRSIAEYCWTLSPCLPWYVLKNNLDIDLITYLDADLFFFSDLQPLFDEIEKAEVVIIEHRFASYYKNFEVNGRFCVEWVSFRRGPEGIACLSRWREQCIDWCYAKPDSNRMGDQKYLDEWPERYSSLHILQHTGAGVAPWNYAQYRFYKNSIGQIMVDEVPLIFYHFHQFQLLNNGKFDRLSRLYTSKCTEPEIVYEIYELAIKAELQDVQTLFPEFSGGLKSPPKIFTWPWIRRLVPRHVKNILIRFF